MKTCDVGKQPHVSLHVPLPSEHTRRSEMEEQDSPEGDEKAITEAISEYDGLGIDSPETPKKEDATANSPPILVPEKTLKKMFKYVLKEASSIRESAAATRKKDILKSVENSASQSADSENDSDLEEIDMIYDEELHYASHVTKPNTEIDENYASLRGNQMSPVLEQTVAHRVIQRLKAKVKRLKKKMRTMEEKHESELQYMANAVTQAISSNQTQTALNYGQSYAGQGSISALPFHNDHRIVTPSSLEVIKKHHESELAEMEECIERMQDEITDTRLSNTQLEQENKHLRVEVLKASKHTRKVQNVIETIQAQIQGIKRKRREEAELFIAEKQAITNQKEAMQVNIVMLQEENKRFKNMIRNLLKDRKEDKDKIEELENEISRLKDIFEEEKTSLKRGHESFKVQVAKKISSLGVDTAWIQQSIISQGQVYNREVPRSMHRHEY